MKKEYSSPDFTLRLFLTSDILAGSDIFVKPGQGSGVGGNDDETEILPNVNGFNSLL